MAGRGHRVYRCEQSGEWDVQPVYVEPRLMEMEMDIPRPEMCKDNRQEETRQVADTYSIKYAKKAQVHIAVRKLITKSDNLD
jgi:hypothetical protein